MKKHIAIVVIVLTSTLHFQRMETTQSPIEKLDQVLKQYHPEFYKCLSPSIKFERYVDSLENFYGRNMHPSKKKFLSELYGWHNGVDSNIYIVPFTYFNRIEVISKFVYADTMYNFRKTGLFPVFGTNGSEIICINLFNDSPVLIQVDFELGYHQVDAFDSFETWVDLSANCFKEGIFYFENVNGKYCIREFDLDDYFKRYRKMNPKTGKLY
jgi:hypothetical protein